MQEIQQEPIAIVGIGCRFPSAETPQAFWRALCHGEEAISEVPSQRWNVEELYSPNALEPGKTVCKWGGFLENIDQFDWRMFRMSPREARYMDPQHRLLLEVAWEALEDAGIPCAEIAGSRTSVTIGINWNDYLRLQARNWSRLDGYTAVGTPLAFAANRLSHFFDLKGQSISLDTACASSLTSIHLACQSLWTGEATLALAGGVNLLLSPDSWIIASKTGLLSRTGHCRTLDANADGFIFGEGAGIVILKPLSLVQPSDRVYALIRGIATNHNGHNEWIMAANQEAQEELLREAYHKAGVDPAEVDYVELHGTAFLKGDAIEARALGTVIGSRATRQHPCAIGSVKANIGHLGAAAGIAGFIKVALSLYYREIPPTLHLQTVNPDIPLAELQLAPQRELTSWPSKPSGRPLAGITALALTGANAHVVLEGCHTAMRQSGHEQPQLRLLPLSATSEAALLAQVAAFKQMLATTEETWQNICYTAAVRRNHHPYRLALAASTIHEATELLNGIPLDQSSISGPRVLLPQSYSALSHKQPEVTLLLTQGQCYVQGDTINWSALFPGENRCVSLPAYPWQRERIWLDWLNATAISMPPENISQEASYQRSAQERQSPSLLHRLEAASVDQWPILLAAYLREEVGALLEVDPSTLQASRSFFSLGMDSLTATQLINHIQQSLGFLLPSTTIFRYSTTERLADFLVQEMLSRQEHTRRAISNAVPLSSATLEDLSETEIETLLTRKLAMIEETLSE